MIRTNHPVIIRRCGVNNCNSNIIWTFEEGEPQTRDDPGMPDFWSPFEGCSEEHMSELTYDDNVQNAIDFMAVMSFDTEWVANLS